jgi:hypothetical protein
MEVVAPFPNQMRPSSSKAANKPITNQQAKSQTQRITNIQSETTKQPMVKQETTAAPNNKQQQRRNNQPTQPTKQTIITADINNTICMLYSQTSNSISKHKLTRTNTAQTANTTNSQFAFCTHNNTNSKQQGPQPTAHKKHKHSNNNNNNANKHKQPANRHCACCTHIVSQPRETTTTTLVQSVLFYSC